MTVPYKNNRTLLLENKSPLTCIMKRKAKLPKITYPAMMEEFEVIDECPDDTYQVVMEDFVNDEHQDIIKNDLVEKNDTEVNNEVIEISIETKNEDVIHKYITDNKTGKITIPIKR